MPILIDACAVINLHNCGQLGLVCGLAGIEVQLSPIVVSECGLGCAAEVMALEAAGVVRFVPDEEISTDRFLQLVGEHDIGDGELESIAVCEVTDRSFCTDDGGARRLATELLGPGRVMGSLRLLKMAVEAAAIECSEAFAGYNQMRGAGGYLPGLEASFFCNEGVC